MIFKGDRTLRRVSLWILLITATVFASSSYARPLNVVATTPDIGWLASELLQNDGNVTILLNGYEDAHAVDAVPSFILAAAKADVFCFVGVSLEIGWAPKVIEKTANQKIQPGRDGYCDVGASIETLEKPKGPVDRSMGDVHPEGNPHYYASLPRLADAADTMAAHFAANLDAKGIQRLQSNLEGLKAKLSAKHKDLKAKLNNHFGETLPTLAQYHGNFTYFFESYGFKLFGNVEDTPGVAPSAGAVASKALKARKASVAMVLAVPHNGRSVVEKFGSIANIPVIVHSDMAQPGRDAIKNPLLLQQSLVEKIIEKLQILKNES